MSKNEKPKYSLLTVFFCDDVEKLSSQTKLNKNILLLKFFNFFCEKYLEIFSVTNVTSDNHDKKVARNPLQFLLRIL